VNQLGLRCHSTTITELGTTITTQFLGNNLTVTITTPSDLTLFHFCIELPCISAGFQCSGVNITCVGCSGGCLTQSGYGVLIEPNQPANTTENYTFTFAEDFDSGSANILLIYNPSFLIECSEIDCVPVCS
jgi:hypothetical protein